MSFCRCDIWHSFGLLGAAMTVCALQACRSDDSDPSRRDLATAALRANRSPAQLVGEGRETSDVDAATDHASRADAGAVPPSRLKDREQLGTDALQTRDAVGLILDAEWRWADVTSGSNAPETSLEAMETLRNATRLRMRIELAVAGRMSITFVGNGYAWPDGTELRSRIDRLGHILVWPDAKRYRNVVAGSLRAMFADRRLDRGHLFVPKIVPQSAGSALGHAVSRQVLSTPVGELQLEHAALPQAGEGATLLCRFLVELMGIDPDTRACVSDQVVLRANLTSAPGGKLQFVVNQVSKKQEIPLAFLQVPPDTAALDMTGAPIPMSLSVPKTQLEALRQRAITAPAVTKDAPSHGLVAINHTLSLRALLLDGLIVAWVPARAEVALPELKSGTYGVSWRDFFGTAVEPPKATTVPARISLGTNSDVGG